MPVYNGMPYITEAVESVLAQDEQNWELVISDNGSTDATRAYLGTLQDPRIRVHLQSANLGIFGNMNFLLAQAQASIAKILCADDTLLPSALAQVAAFMEERPWCAVSRCWRVGDKKSSLPGMPGEIEARLPISLNPKAALLAYLTFGNPVGNLSQAACRPTMIMKCGGFNEKFPYSGDREAWARISGIHGLELQNEELVLERVHPLQNRILLDKKNENILQMNKLITIWGSMVDGPDYALLRRHWIIHVFAQRTPRLIKQIISGKFDLASGVLTDLPLKITPLSVIAAHIIQKINPPVAQKTTTKLIQRIFEENGQKL
jgi:glycosyltransferase involved in cell wall biosynthesis